MVCADAGRRCRRPGPTLASLLGPGCSGKAGNEEGRGGRLRARLGPRGLLLLCGYLSAFTAVVRSLSVLVMEARRWLSPATG